MALVGAREMRTSPFDQTGARDRGFALHLSGHVKFVITPWNALWEFQALYIVVKQAATGSGQYDKYGEYEMAKTGLSIVMVLEQVREFCAYWIYMTFSSVDFLNRELLIKGAVDALTR